MRRVRMLVVVSLVGLGACGSTGGPGSSGAPTTIDGCPPIPSGTMFAAVDYVDFVQWGGVQYLADTADTADVGPMTVGVRDVGPEQFRVSCSYSELNERTGREMPDPVDRSAAFLPAGTVVHALKGWPPQCRLTALREGKWQVYLATVPGAQTVTFAPCALTAGAAATS
jgi:hypothetical protein